MLFSSSRDRTGTRSQVLGIQSTVYHLNYISVSQQDSQMLSNFDTDKHPFLGEGSGIGRKTGLK